MQNSTEHYTEAQMLIRKPAASIYEAFIDPEVTRNFWFTKSSGKLELNKEVEWQWEMYNVSATARAIELVPDSKIVFIWRKPAATVEINLRAISAQATYITIKEYNYTETGDELIKMIRDSTGGFTTVLDGLKAWLEHGIHINLIADKFAKE